MITKKIILVQLLALQIFVIAKSQGWESSSSILSTDRIEAESSALNSSNSFIISGTFEGTTNISGTDYVSNNEDIFICKYDENHNLEWFKQIDGNNRQFNPRITLDNSENIAAVGAFWETVYFSEQDSLESEGFADIFLAKFDDNGNLLSELKIAGGPTAQVPSAIATDNDGNFVISGFYLDSIEFNNGTKLYGNPGIFTTFILKTDENGNYIWSKNILGTNSTNQISNISIFDEGYYFNGKYKGILEFDVETINNYTNDITDIFVYKTDYNGQGQWVRTCSGDGNDASGTITEDLYGNIYLTGFFQSSTLLVDSTDSQISTVPLVNKGNTDIFIVKYNKNGTLQWAKSYGSSGYDWAVNTIQRNNFLYLTGYFSNQIYFEEDTLISSGVNDYDFLYAGFDIDGNLLEAKSFSSSADGDDVGTTMQVSEFNDVYISGYFRSTSITIEGNTYVNLNPGEKALFSVQYKPQFNVVFSDKSVISCQGFSDGRLTVTPYFGVPPYTYTWTKDGSPIAASDSVASNLDAGLYRVSVTDSRDSVATRQIQLNEPVDIAIAYSVSEVTCYNGNNGSIDITVTGGNNNYQYSWTGGTGLSPTSEDQSGLVAADYTVSVTDIKGCVASQTITLGQVDPIIFGESIVVSTNADVDTGRVDLVLNGGIEPYVSFSWEGPDGYTSSEDSIENLNGGNYYLTVTDANSCLADTAFLVPNDSLFIGYMTLVQDVSCGDLTNGQAAVWSNRHTGTDDFFEYIWIDMQDSTQVGGNSVAITNLDSSDYKVFIVDIINEDTTYVKFKIEKPEILSVTSIASNPLCFGSNNGFINAVTSGGILPYSYEWSNNSTEEDIANLGAGTYTLTVTDGNSCTATTEKTLEDPEALSITFDATDPLCTNTLTGSATANVTGGGLIYDYAWNDPGNQTEQTATGLGYGSYTVTVTDQNGCIETASVVLNNPSLVSVTNVESEDASCFEINDGWIKITAEGGSGNYTYNWNHIGLGVDSVGNLGAGTYNVTVNDVNDCTPIIETIIINEPTEIIVDIDTTDNICYGESNGQITVTPSGGSGSFNYSWEHTPDNTGTLTNIASGTYYLTLSDGICPDIIYDIPVSEPAEIVVSIDTTNVSCLNAEDGEIAIITTGGSGDYSYTWSHTTDNVNQVTNLTYGSYDVTISDGICPDITANIFVDQPDPLVFEIDTTDVSCFGLSDGAIAITVTGGSENYTYTWGHTSSDVSELSGLNAGDYNLTISDGACPDSALTIPVREPAELLIVGFDTTNVSEAGSSDGQIIVHVSGGTEPYWYLISGETNSQSDSVFNNLDAGKYVVTINDDNNCGPIHTDTINLEVKVGITNYWEESSITYYPNPADERVTIEINDVKTNSINLKVVNSMGSLLMNKEIEIPNRQNLIELETGHLSQGIYFILIDNMRLKTPLIIK